MTAAAGAVGRAARLAARAEAAIALGQPRRTAEICSMALNLGPEAPLAARLYRLRAEAWRALGGHDLAERDARQAWARDGAPSSRALVGLALFDGGADAAAAVELEAAVSGDPEVPVWWAALGRAYLRGGRAAEAVPALARALAGRKEDRPLVLDLARAHLASQRPGEAEAVLRGVLARNPDDPEAVVLLGAAADARGDVAGAARLFETALTLGGDRPDAHFMLARARLRESGGRDGWAHYEWRQPAGGTARRMGVPAWRGEALAGKRLIVWSEQGMGDNLQFVRYLPLARERGADTLFLAPPTLVRLLRQTPGLGEVIPCLPPYPRGDAHALIMSLSHLLELRSPFDGVPSPYLDVDPARREAWRARLGPGPPTVALVWQGNPAYAGDAERSMPLAFLEPLLRRFRDEIRFVSVQKNAGREQLRDLPDDVRFAPLAEGDGGPRLDLGDAIDQPPDAFLDTAAILAGADAVITTDTAVAHLAGALGRRVWLLLGASPDPRWGAHGRRTGFYPRTRLLRQPRRGDWGSAVAEAIKALSALVRAAARPAEAHPL